MTKQFRRSKGQFFMIAAIFMIVGIVLLRGLLTLPVLSQEKSFQDTNYLDRNLKNIKNEFAYTAGIARVKADPNSTGVEYLWNLSNYVRSQFNSRILYVYVFYNGTSGNSSATVGNFFQSNMTGSLNLTSSMPAGYAFALNDTNSTTFRFNSSAAMINVTLNYTLHGRETVERFYFNASESNYMEAFFDISIEEPGVFVRSKSVYNATWLDRA